MPVKKNKKSNPPRIDFFHFDPGKKLVHKYEIVDQLGEGWEGEVYLLRELTSGIECAGKFFYPDRNLKNKALIRYARKLHKLRHCPIITQYHNRETIIYRRHTINFLVSDFVEGDLLTTFLKRQPGGRLNAFQALHLLHSLASGMEGIHHVREYHGDLHAQNIIIHRFGLGFELKILDFYHWNSPKQEAIEDDVCDMIKLFYDALGGKKHYAKQPKAVKEICCGLKRSLILKKYRTAGRLRVALENMSWE